MNPDPFDPSHDNSPFRTPHNPPGAEAHSRDPSIYAEPWMQDLIHEGSRDPDSTTPDEPCPAADPEHSVWDESGLARALAGELPESGVTWYRAFLTRSGQTSAATTWLVTLGVAAVSGPLAIVAAFLPGLYAGYNTQFVSLTIFAPTVEEVLKVALPVWIVEKRPWLFGSAAQILVCAFASGLAFAAVENLVYLNVYVDSPSASLENWRWTVCVLLHASCSLLSGVGAVRVWSGIRQFQSRPELARAAAPMITAIATHGIYNGVATVLDASGLTF